MILQRVTGPECPWCSCPQSKILKVSTWWGRVRELRSCGYCFKTWTRTLPKGEVHGAGPTTAVDDLSTRGAR